MQARRVLIPVISNFISMLLARKLIHTQLPGWIGGRLHEEGASDSTEPALARNPVLEQLFGLQAACPALLQPSFRRKDMLGDWANQVSGLNDEATTHRI